MGEGARRVLSPNMANLNEEDLIWYLLLPRGWPPELAATLRWTSSGVKSPFPIPIAHRL